MKHRHEFMLLGLVEVRRGKGCEVREVLRCSCRKRKTKHWRSGLLRAVTGKDPLVPSH
jgi:hypothetical protein